MTGFQSLVLHDWLCKTGYVWIALFELLWLNDCGWMDLGDRSRMNGFVWLALDDPLFFMNGFELLILDEWMTYFGWMDLDDLLWMTGFAWLALKDWLWIAGVWWTDFDDWFWMTVFGWKAPYIFWRNRKIPRKYQPSIPFSTVWFDVNEKMLYFKQQINS